MKPFFLFLMASSALWLSACAGMKQDYKNRVCNQNGGYEQGMNDAREGKPMDQSFAQVCDVPGSRDEATNGYRQGYTAGIASNQQAVPNTEINVNIGGASSSHKNFYCEMHPFADAFSAWGSSELEARVNVKNKCMKKYDEMFCKDASCSHS